MGNILLAVDPGLLHPAAALFINGELQAASRVKVPNAVKGLPVAERCRTIAQLIREWYEEPPYWTGQINVKEPETLVVEWPQIYTADKSKGDPNNLVPLAGIDGALAAIFADSKVVSPQPRDWTGNIPKSESGDPWQSPRGQRVWSRLSPDERNRVVVSHDAIDSVGIGLWGLGRFERRRVYETGL